MTSILTSKDINMQTRLRTLKFYVWSTLLYGCETWTISKAMEKRLVATEMWFMRHILRVPWIKRISNEEILRKAQASLKLIKTIHERQFGFFGHVMRKKTLEHEAITGRIEGIKQRLLYTRLLAIRVKLRPVELIHLTAIKDKYHRVTTNVRI